MRIASWNIAWMNDWFVGNNQVAFRQSLTTGEISRRIGDVPALAARVASVIDEMDADILCVQEGPSDIHEMELFATTHLADAAGVSRYFVFGGLGAGSQKSYILVRKNSTDVSAPQLATDPLTSELADVWPADVKAVGVLEDYDFTRAPVVVDCQWGGGSLRVASLHLKANFINNGEALWNSDPVAFTAEALLNRRRISAESHRMRRYLDAVLEADPLQAVIIGGDLNDGPGADFFEDQYLTHNVTDILLGSTYHPARQFEHCFLHRVRAVDRFTARFDDFVTGENDKALILDHILAAPVLRSGGLVAQGLLSGWVAHEAFLRAAVPGAAFARERFPSDHRPVVAEFGP